MPPYDRAVAALDTTRYFRGVTPGIETLRDTFSLPRHRHLRAYATVVLGGSFEEAGYAGRIRATAGDVLIHPLLDCHANRKVTAGLKLIRLEWPDRGAIAAGLYRLDEIDDVARAAERDVREASALLRQLLFKRRRPSPGQRTDWPDLLLRDLVSDTRTEIGSWAETSGLARATVSRGFAAAYGITASTMRAELRARSAWLRITNEPASFSAIAADTGFADQAHMTRWIRRVTGATPMFWRRQSRSRQERPAETSFD